jgi:NADPH2 dehydrogenase
MGMADPKPQFSYVVEQLRKHKLAYIHVVEPMPAEITAEKNSDFLRDIWQGVEGSTFISTNGYTRNSAIETVDNKGGLIGFGRLFMPNVSHLFPDLSVANLPSFSSPIFHSVC